MALSVESRRWERFTRFGPSLSFIAGACLGLASLCETRSLSSFAGLYPAAFASAVAITGFVLTTAGILYGAVNGRAASILKRVKDSGGKDTWAQETIPRRLSDPLRASLIVAALSGSAIVLNVAQLTGEVGVWWPLTVAVFITGLAFGPLLTGTIGLLFAYALLLGRLLIVFLREEFAVPPADCAELEDGRAAVQEVIAKERAASPTPERDAGDASRGVTPPTQ